MIKLKRMAEGERESVICIFEHQQGSLMLILICQVENFHIFNLWLSMTVVSDPVYSLLPCFVTLWSYSVKASMSYVDGEGS